GKRA
ncbi:hypothetical protein J1605_015146, partial [Eschrichtius robustus]